MTKRKIEKMNNHLDLVNKMMMDAGYDQHKLNKAYIVFNLLTLRDEKETFNWVIQCLIRMNEKAENYEICVYLQKVEKQLNRTRRKKEDD